MRCLFYIQFFLLVSVGISQTSANKIYIVKKERLQKIKSFNEMVPDFPKNITWASMEITVNIGGKHGTKFYKGNNPNGFNFSSLSQAKINSFIFVSMKCRVESGEGIYRKYRIKVAE